MKKIYKFLLEPNSVANDVHHCYFDGPPARPISVTLQGRQVCLWAEVDTDAPSERQSVMCVGTGFGRVPDDARFVGTVAQGSFVWHFYAAN